MRVAGRTLTVSPPLPLSCSQDRRSASAGFSLFEIVLALGVVAFALVGIVGLFPAAIKSAQEGRQETRATLIAQQIFADLRVRSGTTRLVVCGGSASDVGSLRTNFSLAVDGSAEFLAYDQDGAGIEGISGSAFTNGHGPACFLAAVRVDTNTGDPNLARVQSTIETPAAAPVANRSKYQFVTLIRR
ncbi:MAG: hypothetical protein WCS65_04240 [Verrucomicrobiae bacterium]